MGKTFVHLKNPETTGTEYKRRETMRMTLRTYFHDTAGVDQEFDNLTLADLAGLDHARTASREG